MMNYNTEGFNQNAAVAMAQNAIRRKKLIGYTRFAKREIGERYVFSDGKGKFTIPENHVLLVLMMGSRRCGKTSILTSMIQSFKALKAEGLHLKPQELTNSYEQNLMDMKRFAQQPFTRAGINASLEITQNEFWIYHEKHPSQAYLLRFIDVPGEWHSMFPQAMQLLFEAADVIITAINTPAMMEEDVVHNRLGAYDELINRSDMINKFLCSACDSVKKRNQKKLFLFVPTKCEKQYFETLSSPEQNELVGIGETIYGHYREFIHVIEKDEKLCKMFTICILPILTLGGVVFSKFDSSNGQGVPDEVYVSYRQLGYQPCFCEQPILYILRYAKEIADQNLRKRRLGSVFQDWGTLGFLTAVRYAFKSPLSEALDCLTRIANTNSLKFPNQYPLAPDDARYTQAGFPQGVIVENKQLGYLTLNDGWGFFPKKQ